MSSASRHIAALAAVILAACGGTSPPPQAQQAPAAVSSPPSSSSYLPLPQVPFAPARPMPVVEAVFHFAADHPEVLSRIPCFCGCENRGHKHNDDCFVAARDQRGRVTAWEPHGIG
jgi:hypothetical protein